MYSYLHIDRYIDIDTDIDIWWRRTSGPTVAMSSSEQCWWNPFSLSIYIYTSINKYIYKYIHMHVKI